MESYSFFQDELIKGNFKKMVHAHIFYMEQGQTIMADDFRFESLYSIIGQPVNTFFLASYMRNLLTVRNRIIKQYAETDD